MNPAKAILLLTLVILSLVNTHDTGHDHNHDHDHDHDHDHNHDHNNIGNSEHNNEDLHTDGEFDSNKQKELQKDMIINILKKNDLEKTIYGKDDIKKVFEILVSQEQPLDSLSEQEKEIVNGIINKALEISPVDPDLNTLIEFIFSDKLRAEIDAIIQEKMGGFENNIDEQEVESDPNVFENSDFENGENKDDL